MVAFEGPFDEERIVDESLTLRQKIVKFKEFTFDDGTTLYEVPCAYKTWGTLNETRDNVVLVCHALTGHADVTNWWEALIGHGRTVDTADYFVVCMNVIGSPYGSVSPATKDPKTGRPYGKRFPIATVRDTVRLQKMVLDHVLQINSIFIGIGPSLGGMQILEWSREGPEYIKNIIPIATCARHSAWCIGWDEAQRQAIWHDPNWNDGDYYDEDGETRNGPDAGLATARMIAMMTYRSGHSFDTNFARNRQDTTKYVSPKYNTYNDSTDSSFFFTIQSYLRYQGRKLNHRFDANCYIRLTQMMDQHDLGESMGLTFEEAMKSIQQPTLLLGVTSDGLYTAREQEEMARLIPKSTMILFDAPDGHDAFFVETEILDVNIRAWVDRQIRGDDTFQELIKIRSKKLGREPI
eukprot:Clim_evm157s147 gene=Clim_evmTU157s147